LIGRVGAAVRGDIGEAIAAWSRSPKLREGVIFGGHANGDMGDLTGDRAADAGGDNKIVAGIAGLRVGEVVRGADDASVCRRVCALIPMDSYGLIQDDPHGATAALEDAEVVRLCQDLWRRSDTAHQGVGGNAIV